MKQRTPIRHHGVPLKKKFGQNILLNEQLLSKIAEIVLAAQPDFLLEVGAGTGALTAFLVDRVPAMTLLEIDPDMVTVLKERFGARENLHIEMADATKVDYGCFLKHGRNNAVTGNLPFVSAVHILKQISLFRHTLSSMTIMVQREVAEKIAATVGSRQFSSLSLYFQYQYSISIAFIIGREQFKPPPKVDAAVLIMKPLVRDDCSPQLEKQFNRLVHAAFLSPRKKVINSFEHSPLFEGDRSTIIELVRAAGVSPDLRPGQIALEDYIAIARQLAASPPGP